MIRPLKIALLGGTRFIGLETALAAVERGHHVSVLHRGIHNPSLPMKIRNILVDREDERALALTLSHLGEVDVLIDTFAMTAPQAEKTNAAMKGKVGHVVVLSSQDVYAQFGSLNGHPVAVIEEVVSETSPLTVDFPFRGIGTHEGGNDYDKKRVEARFSELCSREGVGVTVLRLPGVYGAGDYKRRFGTIVDYLDGGNHELPCREKAPWRWTLGHVRDVAHAIVLAAEKQVKGYTIFNVGEKLAPTVFARAEAIARLMDVDLQWRETESLPDGFGLLGRMPNDFVVSTQRIRDVLGFTEILDQDTAYLDLIEWCRKTRL